jgi:hypothetical protein
MLPVMQVSVLPSSMLKKLSAYSLIYWEEKKKRRRRRKKKKSPVTGPQLPTGFQSSQIS